MGGEQNEGGKETGKGEKEKRGMTQTFKGMTGPDNNNRLNNSTHGTYIAPLGSISSIIKIACK